MSHFMIVTGAFPPALGEETFLFLSLSHDIYLILARCNLLQVNQKGMSRKLHVM
jgi:hypothetical protein